MLNQPIDFNFPSEPIKPKFKALTLAESSLLDVNRTTTFELGDPSNWTDNANLLGKKRKNIEETCSLRSDNSEARTKRSIFRRFQRTRIRVMYEPDSSLGLHLVSWKLL
ncbi:hypothetical protein LIER_14854 [Lithospermum erythrorhizon]|uniref:Uncharacterized protein n=1 Tax=Lithospermum erythrorhizon TaxID=34254 RepID=A0AAV3Q4R3_LITER